MATIQEVETAVRAWVKNGSGLNDAHIYFADQPVPRPSGPFITVRLTDTNTLGFLDLSTNYDATRDPGVEVEVTATSDLEINASIQVWGAPAVTPTSAPDAAPSAIAIALRIVKAAMLPSVSDALYDAGVSLIDVGAVRNLSRLLEDKWEGRAQFDCKFYVRDSVSEFTTFIERAEVLNEDTGDVLVLE